VLRQNITGAATVDVTNREAAELTLTGNVTGLTMTGFEADTTQLQRVRVIIRQDATGGRTFATGGITGGVWPGTAPTITNTAANGISLQFWASTIDGGTTILLEPITTGGGAGTPAGADTQVQYNNAGAFGAEAAFTYNQATDLLTVPNLIVTGAATYSGEITPATITADQNDYNPAGFATAHTLRIAADSPFRALTGLTAGTSGRQILLRNVGAVAIQLRRESASSAAANRFSLPADLRLEPNGAIMLRYDATLTRWVPAHTVFPDPIDPGTPAEMVEDFISSSNETGEVGILGWSFTNGTTAAQANVQNAPGVIRRTGTVTVNQVADLRIALATAFRFDEFDEVWWRCALPVLSTDVTYRFGIADAGTNAAIVHGAYLERLPADTSWFGATVNNSTGGRTAALAAPAANTFFTARIRRISATSVGFSVNRGAEVTLATNIPDAADNCIPFLHIVNQATAPAAARAIDIDYFAMRLLPLSARW